MSEPELDAPPGLPSALPPGEHMVWQGRPDWRMLARRAFKIRWLAAYFAILLVVQLGFVVVEGRGVDGLVWTLAMAGAFAAALGIVAVTAWLTARATTYTITTKRVVMRVGATLSMDWNLPFKRIASADLKVREEGDGDIVLHLTPPDRAHWLLFWPNVQPGRILDARPAMRAIPEPARVAALLRDAVARWATHEATTVKLGDAPEVARRDTDDDRDRTAGSPQEPMSLTGPLAHAAGR